MLNKHSEETLKQIMKLNEIKLRGDTKMPIIGTKFPDKHEYRKERFFAVEPDSGRYIELNFKYLKTFDSKTHPNTDNFICQWTVKEPVFLIPNFFGGTESYASTLLEQGYRLFTTFDSSPYLDFVQQYDGDTASTFLAPKKEVVEDPNRTNLAPSFEELVKDEEPTGDGIKVSTGAFESIGSDIDHGIKVAVEKIEEFGDKAVTFIDEVTSSTAWKVIKGAINHTTSRKDK